MSERFIVMQCAARGDIDFYVVKDIELGRVAPFTFKLSADVAAEYLNIEPEGIARYNWGAPEDYGVGADDGFCSGHNVPVAKETEGGGSQSASSTTGERSPAPAVRRGPVEAIAMEMFRAVDTEGTFADWDEFKDHDSVQARNFMRAAEYVLKNFERKAGR